MLKMLWRILAPEATPVTVFTRDWVQDNPPTPTQPYTKVTDAQVPYISDPKVWHQGPVW